MNKQTEELSQNTFKQHRTASLWIVPNTKMQKDLRSRHHQPQICNEMLKFICKNGEFPSTLHARSLPSSIFIRTFREKTFQLCLSTFVSSGTFKKNKPIETRSFHQPQPTPTNANQTQPTRNQHLSNPIITSRCSMLAGAPYLNVNALEVSVVATSTSRDKIGGQAYNQLTASSPLKIVVSQFGIS